MSPFLTITHGISVANTDAVKKTVVVAEGTYGESIALADGVGVYGQYSTVNWARDLTNYTVVNGVSSMGVHDRTVVASNISGSTILDGFVIYGSVNAKVGGNSYAIYIANANANLHITHNIIFGGHGGPGVVGTSGADGANGVSGTGRNANLSVSDALYDAFDAIGSGECNSSSNRQYANGGTFTCGSVSVSGGAGGGNRCPVMSSCTTQAGPGCNMFTWIKYTALGGSAGNTSSGANDGAAGNSATSGDDSIQVYSSNQGGYVCYLSGMTTSGLNGNNGGDGGNAAGVAGCTAATGSVVGGDWMNGIAPNGNAGGNGGGASGGGAGGGGKCEPITGHTTCADGNGKDTLGGHGGGGGSGACAGAGGASGGSGGGTFAIFIYGGSAAPVVTVNRIFAGTGGRGGSGGNGGFGGIGGGSGLGGTTGVPVIFCTDVAGHGGSGGSGGDGSGGGGGCGGSSFGIYTFGVGTPNYCQAGASNSFVSGAAGAGGTGGLSFYNAAGAGADGTSIDCSFMP
ncbi:hypothetical protein [Pseudolysobacter antarcticus]|uniref:hypothetical protein n=1 Tax=Pseudolysobacter antarcticus TaxID=2511995 RepID=UPI0013EBD277|nr:hypothetical protein [Pseudolysobacter antarcticus]